MGSNMYIADVLLPSTPAPNFWRHATNLYQNLVQTRFEIATRKKMTFVTRRDYAKLAPKDSVDEKPANQLLNQVVGKTRNSSETQQQ